MTDDIDNTLNEILARFDRIERLQAGMWPANKAAVLASLAAAGVTQVVVTFDGYGDSGQVESIEAKAGDAQVDLPCGAIAWQGVDSETEATVTTGRALNDAIEDLVYGALRQTHCGWENNEGAFGEVTFDVTQGTVTLDYNERYEASEYLQHIL